MAKAKSPKAWKPPNRGTAFKETDKGVLFLDFQTFGIEALRPSPARCWEKFPGKKSRWRGQRRPRTQLGEVIRQIRAEDAIEAGASRRSFLHRDRPPMRPFETRRRKNMRKFLAHVDDDVVNQLAHRFPFGDWPLFRLLTANARATEHCNNGHHALMFALSRYDALVTPIPKASGAFWARWLARPLPVLAGRLGFPATKASVRVLKRLTPEASGPELLAAARAALHGDDGRKRLLHAGQVTPALVVLCQPGLIPRVQPSLLAEVEGITDPQTGRTFGNELTDLMRLERQLDERKRPRFSSVLAIKERHNMLVKKAQNRRLDARRPFPPSPLDLQGYPGMTTTYLSTASALVEEGRRMRHCLGTLDSHHTLAEKGRFFAYAVTAGSMKATLAFLRRPQGWMVYDFTGFANTAVPRELYRWAEQVAHRAGRPHEELPAEDPFLHDDLPF